MIVELGKCASEASQNFACSSWKLILKGQRFLFVSFLFLAKFNWGDLWRTLHKFKKNEDIWGYLRRFEEAFEIWGVLRRFEERGSPATVEPKLASRQQNDWSQISYRDQ